MIWNWIANRFGSQTPGKAGRHSQARSLTLEALETRELLAVSSYLAVGADAGGGPHVRVFHPTTGAEQANFFAFDPGFRGGVRLAVGDVTGDGTPDWVTAPGPGGGPNIRVFNGRTNEMTFGALGSFFAFDPQFGGGVYVATGDVNGDGVEDIIASAGSGGGPHVKVFSGTNGEVLRNFFAYAPGFLGGVRVASGDIDGDGHDDIITSPGPGGGPHVKTFSGRTGEVLREFFAYDASFTGGVYVTAGRVNGHEQSDIVTSADVGGSPLVRIFDAIDGRARGFFAYDPSFFGGVRVGVSDLNLDGRDDVITNPGPGGSPLTRFFDGNTLNSLGEFFSYDAAFRGGVFGAGVTNSLSGETTVRFTDPLPGDATFNIDSNFIQWGVAADDEDGGESFFQFFPRSISTDSRENVNLGFFVYGNFATELGTTISSVNMELTITLNENGESSTQTVSLPIEILTRLNTDDPEASRDTAFFTTESHILDFTFSGGRVRRLELLGFAERGTTNPLTTLSVNEGERESVQLLGRFTSPARFVDGPWGFREQFKDKETFYFGKSWTKEDKDLVEEALAILEKINPALVKNPDGSPLTFVRLGSNFGGPKFEGYNNNEVNKPRLIFLTDDAFRVSEENPDPVKDKAKLFQTVFHEVGHNWDQSEENPLWNQFIALSDWEQQSTVQTGFEKGKCWDFNQWVYNKAKAKFSDDRALTDPREDFAVAFATHIVREVQQPVGSGQYFALGETTSSTRPEDEIRDKVDFIKTWLNTL